VNGAAAPRPWYLVILSERGLGALLSIVLVVGLLWGGFHLATGLQASSERQVEQLANMSDQLAEIQNLLERIEISTRAGGR